MVHIVERGAQDMKSEIERFSRLFRADETIPGLTWPTITFTREMTLWLGKLEVKLLQLGRGHTKGDTVAWLPEVFCATCGVTFISMQASMNSCAS